MVIWSTIEASCPMCSNRTRLREVGGGFAVGQDSDLLVRMTGKHVIQAEVHTCNQCRFSGYAADFVRTISPLVRSRFLEEVSPALRDPIHRTRAGGEEAKTPPVNRTPLPDVQYFWAYRTAQTLALPAIDQAERLLRAYWCLRLPPSAHLPEVALAALRKAYLKGAVQKLREALPAEKNANWVYLTAELCRRNGNHLLALAYFRQFLAMAAGPKYLRVAAAKLTDLARRRSSEAISMEEILYDRAPDGKPQAEGS